MVLIDCELTLAYPCKRKRLYFNVEDILFMRVAALYIESKNIDHLSSSLLSLYISDRKAVLWLKALFLLEATLEFIAMIAVNLFQKSDYFLPSF